MNPTIQKQNYNITYCPSLYMGDSGKKKKNVISFEFVFPKQKYTPKRLGVFL